MLEFVASSLILFIALLAGLEVGRWLRRRRRDDGETSSEVSAAADGLVFAVLGLLIAFTFTSSASRFDDRRKLIVDQANALGTAWLRLDLLPEVDREPIRKGMREWVKLAIEYFPVSDKQDTPEFEAMVKRSQALQDQTWAAAVAAVDRHPKALYATLILPPINDWIDLSSTRLEMRNRGLPPLVMPTLILLAMISAVLAGYHMGRSAKRSPLHTLAFAGAIAFSLYVILDLNHPRAGLIRIDASDHAMEQLYNSMTAGTAGASASKAVTP